MGLLKILEGTSVEKLKLMRDERKALGLAFLQGSGNRRRRVRVDAAASGRRTSNNALYGRRSFDSGSSNRRQSDFYAVDV